MVVYRDPSWTMIQYDHPWYDICVWYHCRRNQFICFACWGNRVLRNKYDNSEILQSKVKNWSSDVFSFWPWINSRWTFKFQTIFEFKSMWHNLCHIKYAIQIWSSSFSENFCRNSVFLKMQILSQYNWLKWCSPI